MTPWMKEQVRAFVAQVQLLTSTAEKQEHELRAAEASRTILLQQMIDLQAQVIAQASASRAGPSRVTFVDVKGIGKPATFSSEPR